MSSKINYDVVVVGAGHAGCEAAHAAATMGSTVLLITMNMETIAKMSCNPAMGGVAKGQIVREIDALGGMSGIITDKTMIQFRMLNMSKGPAMWSPRAQSDRWRFSEEWRLALEQNHRIHFIQDTVVDIEIKNQRIESVITGMGEKIKAKTVVLTNGTFLNGIIHIGETQSKGGRMGENAAYGLTEKLLHAGFTSGRMKTGTPPRVDGRSLDYSKMEEQKGDAFPSKFSFSSKTIPLQDQRSCFITYTNQEVHDILKEGFDKSPMYNGSIKGLGPRYCPSIEDKINRFAERERHQIFVEPEGWNTVEVYVNGFSTSLPAETQYKAIKRIPGFENARVFRPGYAIEYDYFQPTQLKETLETKLIDGLFFAGQINGTTGYEEAACQGLMAGINAHLKSNDKDAFILKRDEAYIGVLIDDLINKGTEEPYRMFTSRAEYRILLRQDNADERLTPRGYDIGLADSDRLEELNKKREEVEKIIQYIENKDVLPDTLNSFLAEKNTAAIHEKTKLKKLILRPQIALEEIVSLPEYHGDLAAYSPDSLTSAEITVKYEGYIEKERNAADKIHKLEHLNIPSHFDYHKLTSLSMEAREKLSKIKPTTIGQASRISGVSPSDISILLVYFGR